MRRSRVALALLVGSTLACGSSGGGDALDAGVDALVADDGRADATDAPADAHGPDADPADVRADVRADAATGETRTCWRYVDAHASERASCAFAAGAHASATLGDGSAARTAIRHLIVMLHENRSFDHYFGHTGGDLEGLPASFTNPDTAGPVAPFHYRAGCICDVPHDFAHVTGEWDHGAMDGFVRTDGLGAFGYFDDADHPFYTWLMTTFATSDRYFCAALDDTGHNRHFLWHANATGGAPIFDALDAATVTWTNYYEGSAPLYNDLGAGASKYAAHTVHDPGLTQLYAALADGSGKLLPQLTIVDQGADEHPPGDIHRGEAATRQLVEKVLASPLWPQTALVFTYDEGGGLLDHVPPPPACVATTAASEAPYDNLGIRVPIAIVSPWSRRGFVSHETHSHTSLTRLIELLYDLPALTARDASSDALLDLFDFDCPPFAAPPTSASIPAAGPPGCPSSCASGP